MSPHGIGVGLDFFSGVNDPNCIEQEKIMKKGANDLYNVTTLAAWSGDSRTFIHAAKKGVPAIGGAPAIPPFVFTCGLKTTGVSWMKWRAEHPNFRSSFYHLPLASRRAILKQLTEAQSAASESGDTLKTPSIDPTLPNTDRALKSGRSEKNGGRSKL